MQHDQTYTIDSSHHSFPLEEGLAELRAGRLDQAEECLRAALIREPGRFAAVRALATALLLNGKSQLARDVLECFNRDHPMVPEGWRLAALLEWKLGARSGAIGLLRSGIKRLSHSPILIHQLNLFLAAESDVSTSFADRFPNEPSQADPDWLDQIAADSGQLASILTCGDHTESTASCEMLISLEQKLSRLVKAQPSHADRLLLLGRIRARIGDGAGAKNSTDQAIQINPGLKITLVELAESGPSTVPISNPTFDPSSVVFPNLQIERSEPLNNRLVA